MFALTNFSIYVFTAIHVCPTNADKKWPSHFCNHNPVPWLKTLSLEFLFCVKGPQLLIIKKWTHNHGLLTLTGTCSSWSRVSQSSPLDICLLFETWQWAWNEQGLRRPTLLIQEAPCSKGFRQLIKVQFVWAVTLFKFT